MVVDVNIVHVFDCNFIVNLIYNHVSLVLLFPLDVSLAPQYLDRIGQLFFGVPPKQSPSYGGLLGEWTEAFAHPSRF